MSTRCNTRTRLVRLRFAVHFPTPCPRSSCSSGCFTGTTPIFFPLLTAANTHHEGYIAQWIPWRWENNAFAASPFPCWKQQTVCSEGHPSVTHHAPSHMCTSHQKQTVPQLTPPFPTCPNFFLATGVNVCCFFLVCFCAVQGCHCE